MNLDFLLAFLPKASLTEKIKKKVFSTRPYVYF